MPTLSSKLRVHLPVVWISLRSLEAEIHRHTHVDGVRALASRLRRGADGITLLEFCRQLRLLIGKEALVLTCRALRARAARAVPVATPAKAAVAWPPLRVPAPQAGAKGDIERAHHAPVPRWGAREEQNAARARRRWKRDAARAVGPNVLLVPEEDLVPSALICEGVEGRLAATREALGVREGDGQRHGARPKPAHAQLAC